ncbi:MAG TPA: Trm112 family protein [Alphaproteobacteria bacterium]
MTNTPISTAPATQTDATLLGLLICPITRTTLRYDSAKQILISDAAKLAFPIRDGIPIMLVDEAEQL